MILQRQSIWWQLKSRTTHIKSSGSSEDYSCMHLHLNKFYKESKCSDPSTTNKYGKTVPKLFFTTLFLSMRSKKTSKDIIQYAQRSLQSRLDRQISTQPVFLEMKLQGRREFINKQLHFAQKDQVRNNICQNALHKRLWFTSSGFLKVPFPILHAMSNT